jgi:hypothetical protein
MATVRVNVKRVTQKLREVLLSAQKFLPILLATLYMS